MELIWLHFFLLFLLEQNEYEPYFTKPIEKNAKVPLRKVSIPGSELDSSLNTTCYPPPRWVSLKPTAPSSVSFIELVPAENHENTFRNLAEQVFKVSRAIPAFEEIFGSVEFVNVPVAPSSGFDLSSYFKFLHDPNQPISDEDEAEQTPVFK